MARVNTGRVHAQMTKNPLDHTGLLDACNDPELVAAAPAALNLDREHALQPRRPGSTSSTSSAAVSAIRRPPQDHSERPLDHLGADQKRGPDSPRA